MYIGSGGGVDSDCIKFREACEALELESELDVDLVASARNVRMVILIAENSVDITAAYMRKSLQISDLILTVKVKDVLSWTSSTPS